MKSTFAVLLCAAPLLTVGVSSAIGQEVSKRPCGSRTSHGIATSITSSKATTCRKARRIVRAFNDPTTWTRTVNGASGAAGYTYLKPFPGWKCVSGSGGGSCSKRSQTVAYQTRVVG